MRIIVLVVLFLWSLHLTAQDLSALQVTNVRTTSNTKGIEVKFDYFYPSNFPDSMNFAMIARLKSTNSKDLGVSKRIHFMKHTRSVKSSDRIITIPYRDIELNEGSHLVQIELGAFHEEGIIHILAATNFSFQQPKRYLFKIEITGGQISTLNSSGQTWDTSRLFSNKKEHKLPDPAWWVYIESTYLNTPSKTNTNSFVAPDADFRIVALQSEKIYVKLFDEDDFINKDDHIGTFRILHPNELMDLSLLNQNAENVSDFNVKVKKTLHLVEN